MAQSNSASISDKRFIRQGPDAALTVKLKFMRKKVYFSQIGHPQPLCITSYHDTHAPQSKSITQSKSKLRSLMGGIFLFLLESATFVFPWYWGGGGGVSGRFGGGCCEYGGGF